jgi:undecaprenyl diphosphate synthase
VSTAPAFSTTAGVGTPRHIAIIMDGNGRWAKKRFLPRIAGHRKGIEAAKTIVRTAGDLGIEVLTLYAFSTENWNRPEEEVNDLMALLKHFIQRDIAELAENGVRLRVIGNYRALSKDLVTLIDDAIAQTAANQRTTLVIALNYGAQDELIRAANAAAQHGQITADSFEAHLDTAGLPPVDLLIRTSGEQRLSNFLLWQLAYAEMIFTDTLWPDFNGQSLTDAVASYAGRERRFGGL